MTWDVICHILRPFGLLTAQKSSFELGENLLLLHREAVFFQPALNLYIHEYRCDQC